ncbi:MAG TPA: AI-2E family transporter [Gemmatimonadaceae bacterium]|nr:AI-2E family transporter [Gemmatimonadaceae bacterium]
MNDANAGRVKLAPILTTVILTVLLLWMVGKTAGVFLLLFIATILSLYLGAVRDFLMKRGKMGPRLAFFVAVVGTLVALGVLIGLLVPPVIEQTKSLIDVLPDYIAHWEKGIDNFVARFPALRSVYPPGQHQALQAIYDRLSSTAGDVLPKVLSIVNTFIDAFAVMIMAIYMALAPGVYREWVIALFPPVHRDLVRDVLRDLADTLRSYIVAQLSTMAILATLTAIGLYLLNVPYWLTFGIFTGLVAIVPFFGTLLSTTIPALFVLSGPNGGTHALYVILLGVVIHLIEGNLVSPLLMSSKVELPPVLTIMSVLVIGKILGPLGLVIAVPTLATIMVVVRRILINRIYEGRGFRKSTRDRVFVLRVPAPDGGVLTPHKLVEDVMAHRGTMIADTVAMPIVRPTARSA